jgi:hypothetical protein
MRRLQKKEKMLYNTVVEAVDEEHAKQIVKHYIKQGYDARNYSGTCWTGKYSEEKTYYGVINGLFGMYNEEHLTSNTELVKLPKSNKNELKRLQTINEQIRLQLSEVQSMNERLNEQMENVRKAIS